MPAPRLVADDDHAASAARRDFARAYGPTLKRWSQLILLPTHGRNYEEKLPHGLVDQVE